MIGHFPNIPLPNPAAVYVAKLAPGSRRTMSGCILRLAAMLGSEPTICAWHTLRYAHTQQLRAQLAERYVFSTANLHIAALRGVLKEAWRLGLMPVEEYYRAADIQTIKGHRELAGRYVAPTEIRDLFTICDAGPAGARDAAILAILAGAGLRRSEVVALTLADYAAGALKVLGKGNKARTAYVTNSAKVAVDHWLAVRGQDPGALLCPVQKGGKIVLRHMSDSALRLRLVALAKRADVFKLSPHDLRRTWVSDLLDLGADLVLVQGMAGHSSPASTAQYDRRSDRVRCRAAQLLDLPTNSDVVWLQTKQLTEEEQEAVKASTSEQGIDWDEL